MSKSKPVSLKDVTADNWEKIVSLELTDEQEEHVASNVYSIAESKYTPHAVPKAVYAGSKPVGFIMYERLADYGAPNDYLIYRFMIDRHHQGKGYGRDALELAIAGIRMDPRWRRIIISYVPENAVAKKFYASLGFVETGLDDDGEMAAEIVNKR